MSASWADRQRRTNRLVRAIATYLFSNERSLPTPDQIHGLCKLTWITKSYLGAHASYIKAVKIPALEAIFGRDYSGQSLEYVARDAANLLEVAGIEDLILSHTGFTNLYNVFRNSSRDWLADNFAAVLPLFRRALMLKSDADALALIEAIETLPAISKPREIDKPMNPGHFLTPVFFALDPRLRFPLINGAKHLNTLLTALKVGHEPLSVQFGALVKLIGTRNITDAADIDQISHDGDLAIARDGTSLPVKILGEQPTEGNELSLKDDSDIETIKKAQTLKQRRLHNTLTNKLRAALPDFSLREGNIKSAQFDAMVLNFDGEKHDLLIEVKSSVDIADVRMAIGQVYSYWFSIRGETEWEATHLAILLPQEPAADIQKLLAWCELGLLWFVDDKLETSSDWLRLLTDDS